MSPHIWVCRVVERTEGLLLTLQDAQEHDDSFGRVRLGITKALNDMRAVTEIPRTGVPVPKHMNQLRDREHFLTWATTVGRMERIHETEFWPDVLEGCDELDPSKVLRTKAEALARAMDAMHEQCRWYVPKNEL